MIQKIRVRKEQKKTPKILKKELKRGKKVKTLKVL
jgi:hypothetical protein